MENKKMAQRVYEVTDGDFGKHNVRAPTVEKARKLFKKRFPRKTIHDINWLR